MQDVAPGSEKLSPSSRWWSTIGEIGVSCKELSSGHSVAQTSEDRKKLIVRMPRFAFGDDGRAKFTTLVGPLCREMPTDKSAYHVLFKIRANIVPNRVYLGIGSTASAKDSVPGGRDGIGFAIHGEGGFDQEGPCKVEWEKKADGSSKRKPQMGGYGDFVDHIGVGVDLLTKTVTVGTRLGRSNKQGYETITGQIELPPSWFFALGFFFDSSQASFKVRDSGESELADVEILSAGPGDLLDAAAKYFHAETQPAREAPGPPRRTSAETSAVKRTHSDVRVIKLGHKGTGPPPGPPPAETPDIPPPAFEPPPYQA